MKFKTFTQAYFLIKYNSSYGHSLGKRAATIVGIWFTYFTGVYMFWPRRIYAVDNVN
jgi:hypothetical protein